MLTVTKENYKSLIEGDKPVLLDFWAPWCVYCRRLTPALEQVARREDIVVGMVNIDEEPQLSEFEQIEVIPTLILYHKGEVLGTVVNPGSKAGIDAFLSQSLKQVKL